MNKILEKAITELRKEGFSKEYVLGMLETLLEMQGEPIRGSSMTKMVIENGAPIAVGVDSQTDKTPEEIALMVSEARVKEIESMGTIEEVTQK